MSAAQPLDRNLSILYPKTGGNAGKPVPQSFYAMGVLNKAVRANRIVAKLSFTGVADFEQERAKVTFQRHPHNAEQWFWAVRFKYPYAVDGLKSLATLTEAPATLDVVAYKGATEVARDQSKFKLRLNPVAPTITFPGENEEIQDDLLSFLPCWGEWTSPDDVYLLTLSYASKTGEAFSENDNSWWGYILDIPQPGSRTPATLVASGSGLASDDRNVFVQ
ncbi:hypothetical protein [Gemmata sp.]|uniref:hypothetical protein n=1 Tax=Gemmata sp. TaxID=1914242 RepID=UPI003F7014E4